ncbi:response regulator [Tropicimonas aquimaris]|uniref:histidine kinase n=1 Tax=Tropicimonas aquimaris TaxID=914152 RepID=A0ABW3IVX1_9RHOB
MSIGLDIRRIASNRIPLHIGSLTAVLLGALVISTVIVAYEFTANQKRISEATARFHRLQVAAEAERHFGTMRYWLTELAVSLLTLSEKRAEEARAQLSDSLEGLGSFAPAPAERIAEAVDGYWDSSIAAVDAYTDGNRIIGNTLMAQTRQQSAAVTEEFAALVSALAEEADAANATAADASVAAKRRALMACLAIVATGALATVWVLRRILGPLGRIDAAMADIRAGQPPQELPPEGPDEFGRLSRTLRDLHETQQARRELEAAAAEQRRTVLTAIETIPDGFALYDEDDQLVLRNQRFVEMFPSAASLSESASYSDFLDAAMAAGEVDLVGAAAAEWKAGRLARHADPTGSREEVPYTGGWMMVTRRKTPDGGTVCVYSDITELRRRQSDLETARQEAETANESKSRFLASMSHELRTPLNAIIGYSEMLIEDAEDGGDTSTVPDLERIMASGRHLLSLINDILDLSKIEAGKMELHVERVDVPQLVRDVEATVAPLIARNGNTLEVAIAPDVGEIDTDHTKLRQNLFNLLSNAAKFTENGRIALGVRSEGGFIRFDVRDEGIGMTEEQLGRLFKPFSQAESSTSSVYGGTGLGLSIVRSFTEMMGGDVSVTSEPGKGSCFTLRLPEIAAAVRGRDAGDAAFAVLIIDDDTAALSSMAEYVRAQGYKVFAAYDAQTGLDLARTRRPDVILLDVIMPERDGWSVLRELKKDPALCETPVILVSVVTDRDMGLAFGAVDHMVKPVDPARLIERINRLVGERSREVLIVDDDPATRALFRRLLVREGWSVREAADGARALALIGEEAPGLVVLDLMMPNIDGFEVLRRLRAASGSADIPVIVATSKDLTRREIEWLGDHAREVVQKGADGRSDLLAAIQRHVGHAPDTAGDTHP